MEKCVFCAPDKKDIVLKSKYFYARFDKYPVSKGHILIIPFRHFPNYFDILTEEKKDLWDFLDKVKEYSDNNFSPDGYNIGINVGECAGQSVFHLHVHLIPRYKGDMPDPKGGVRGVIPEKRKY